MDQFMKVLLILLALTFSFEAYAQNQKEVFCTELVRQLPNDSKEVIRLTNTSEIRLNDLNSGALYQLAFVKNESQYDLIIRAIDEKCFSSLTPVTLYFRNGEKIQFKSSNKENCKSLLTVNLGSIQESNQVQVQLLEHYLIGIQYFTSSEEVVKLKVGTPQNELIQELFECISK